MQVINLLHELAIYDLPMNASISPCLFILQCDDLYFAYQARRVIEGYMQTSVTGIYSHKLY